MNTSFLSVAKPSWFMILVLLISVSTVCHAQTSISKLPYTITKPGSYALRKSLVYAYKSGQPLAAITVNCDDVKIDLLGNTISVDREISKLTETAGIFANQRNNVSIRNGAMKGFFRGVYLEGINGSNHLVESIEATDSTFLGIQVKGRGCIIRNNFVNGVGRAQGASNYTALRYGMDITGAACVVKNNRVLDVTPNTTNSNNSSYGIYIHDTEAAVIQGNDVMNTNQSFLNFNSRGIRLHNCISSVAEDNRVATYPAGFDFSSCDFTIYRDNTVTRSIQKYYNSTGTNAEDGGGNQ